MKPDPHPQVSWLRPSDRRVDKADLWIGFNTLVSGPPGSGKLSFIRAMAVSLDPLATCVVYDLESDPDTQMATTRQLLENIDSGAVGSRLSDRIVHVLRHLHRLPSGQLVRLLAELEGRLLGSPAAAGDGKSAARASLHATHHEDAVWSETAELHLSRVFPCRVRLSRGCSIQRDLAHYVRHVVAELNRRYGRQVDEIEAGMIEAIRMRASTANLYELRSLIEKAYLLGSGSRLSAEAIGDGNNRSDLV